MDIKHLKISLEKLKADTKPRWGRMNSSQMLKHCNRQAKLYCNEYNSNFFVLLLAHTIGKLHLLYVKYYINYDINKYKKNSRGLRILDTTQVQEIDFKKEKQKLIKRHIYVNNYEKKFIVNPIHGLVKKETFKKNIFARFYCLSSSWLVVSYWIVCVCIV